MSRRIQRSVRVLGATGSSTVNVVPSPTLDLTLISPLCSSIIRWVMARPRPVPLSFGGEERGEKLFHVFFGYPVSFVFHVDADPVLGNASW